MSDVNPNVPESQDAMPGGESPGAASAFEEAGVEQSQEEDEEQPGG